jgi:O-antigen ligase
MRATFGLSVSYWLGILARVSFAAVLFFTPFRWRIVLWSRPTFPVYPDYTDFLLYSADIALIFTIVFWGCSLLLSPRKLALGSALIWISLICLTLAGLVSSVGGEDSVLSRYQGVRLVLLFLFYLYIVNEITLPEWVLVPVGLQILLQSVIAISQSLLQRSLGWLSLGELRLDPQVAGVSIVPSGGLRFLRAYGLADHPNILGGCLAFGLILLFAWMMYGSSKSRWFALIAFLPGLLALVLTFSRSAWLGFLTGASFMVGLEALLRRWNSVKYAALIASISLLIVIPLLNKNAELFRVRMDVTSAEERFEQQSLDERAFLIRSGATIFAEHSALGIGLGASPLALKSRFPGFPTNYQPPHYTLLVAAMETGVVGAAFYSFLIVAPVIDFLSHWRAYVERPVLLGAFALLLALMVIGLFDYYTWLNNAGRIWQWLAWGLWSTAKAV